MKKCFLAENKQLWCGKSNSALQSDASHHVIVDYFPILAYYTALNDMIMIAGMITVHLDSDGQRMRVNKSV